MYIKLKENHVKDLNKEVHKNIKDELNLKNMEYQDVQVILSVELKDEKMPSKTLMEYERKNKSFKNDSLDMMSKLFETIDTKLKDGSDEQFDPQKLVKENKKKLDKTSKTVEKEMLKLFKEMIKDKDNKMVLFVKNSYIELQKDVELKSYNSLPDSIKQLVKDKMLVF